MVFFYPKIKFLKADWGKYKCGGKFDFLAIQAYSSAMNAEKVLYANDLEVGREGMKETMRVVRSESGHKLIGMVSSVGELETFLKSGQELPTVFILDPRFPTSDDGEEAVRLIKELSPKTKIVTSPSHDFAKFVDEKHKLPAWVSPEQLVDFLTNLQG